MLLLQSPFPNMTEVPRDVELRFVGDVEGLDASPPRFRVSLVRSDNSQVALVRSGGVAHANSVLDPNELFTLHIETTSASDCVNCPPSIETPFTTSSDVDVPPESPMKPAVNVFVFPSAADAAACDFIEHETHQIAVQFGPNLPLNQWIEVAGRTPTSTATLLALKFNRGARFTFTGDLGASLPVAIGDEITFAFVARDLTGKLSRQIIQVAAQTFRDTHTGPVCEIPPQPQLDAPRVLPANGRFAVTFPLEEVPIAAATPGFGQAQLEPLDDISGGHVYAVPSGSATGARISLVTLPCVGCVCADCTASGSVFGILPPAQATADTEPPAVPQLVAIDEDANPAVSCPPKQPALLLSVRSGHDNVSPSLDLRYDVELGVGNGPTVVVGRHLAPVGQGGADELIRVQTGLQPPLLEKKLRFTIRASDAAGNASEASFTYEPPSDLGCSGRGIQPVTAILAPLLSCRFRKRISAHRRRSSRK
jgi:hypothetical protein